MIIEQVSIQGKTLLVKNRGTTTCLHYHIMKHYTVVVNITMKLKTTQLQLVHITGNLLYQEVKHHAQQRRQINRPLVSFVCYYNLDYYMDVQYF